MLQTVTVVAYPFMASASVNLLRTTSKSSRPYHIITNQNQGPQQEEQQQQQQKYSDWQQKQRKGLRKSLNEERIKANNKNWMFTLQNLRIKRLKQREINCRKWRLKFTLNNCKDLKFYDTFHRAIRTFLFCGHIFGLMPLSNTLDTNPQNIRFRVNSKAMFFTIFFLLFGGYKTLVFTGGLLDNGINAKNIVGVVFFTINITTCLQFLSLAKQWPNLIKYWTKTELTFLLPPYEQIGGWSLRKRLNTIASAFGLIAFLEHCMFYMSGYYNYYMYIVNCSNRTQATFQDFLVERQYKDVFANVSFNIPFAFYAFFLNGTFTVIWNFLDIFIMLVGVSLAMRFEQFAHRLRKVTGNFVPDAVWYEIRQHYTQLCELMECVDDQLGNLVIISSLNNMYFICNQLLNIFTKLRYPINYLYFWFSMGFLLLRTASVFMCAAKIYDASSLPLKFLYLVPPGENWSEEVQRFMLQIAAQQDVGLSGKRFFLVTRKSLFGLAATIITYEFMLLQFDAKNRGVALPDLCL